MNESYAPRDLMVLKEKFPTGLPVVFTEKAREAAEERDRGFMTGQFIVSSVNIESGKIIIHRKEDYMEAQVDPGQLATLH